MSPVPGGKRLGLIALAASGASGEAPFFASCAGNVIAASATSSAWAQRTVAEGQAAGNPLAVGLRPAQHIQQVTPAELPRDTNLTQEELLLELMNFVGNSSNTTIDGMGRSVASRFDLPPVTTSHALHQFFEHDTLVNWTSASPHGNTTDAQDRQSDDEAIEATLEKLKSLLPHNANESVAWSQADLRQVEGHFKDLLEQLQHLSTHGDRTNHSQVAGQGDTRDPSLFSAGGATARYFAELYGALVATQAVGVAHGVIDGFGNVIKNLVSMKNVPKDPQFFRSQQLLLSLGWGAQAGARKGFSDADGADAISTYLKAFETSPTGQVALTFLLGLGIQALPYIFHGITKKPINFEPVPSLWQLLKVPQMVWERCFAALESELHTGPIPVPKALLQAALNVALDEMKANGVDADYVAIAGALFTFLIHADRIYQFIKYKKAAEANNIGGVMPNDAERMALTSLQTFLFSSMNLHALVGMGASPPGADDAALQSPTAQFLVGGLLVGGLGGRALAAALKSIVHRLVDKVPATKLPANFHKDKLDATIDMVAAAQASVGSQYLAGPYAGLLARLLASVPAIELAEHMRDCIREMCARPVVRPTSPGGTGPRRDSMEMSPLTGGLNRRDSQPDLADLRRSSEPDLTEPAAVIHLGTPHPRSPHANEGPLI
jgi:hypothetical protein